MTGYSHNTLPAFVDFQIISCFIFNGQSWHWCNGSVLATIQLWQVFCSNWTIYNPHIPRHTTPLFGPSSLRGFFMSVLRPLLAKMSRNCRNELKTVKMPENICGSQFESLNAPCFALMDQRPRFFDQCNIVLSKIIERINGIFTIHTRHTILKRMKCDIVLSKTTQANL